jgi:hypothetical protein
MKLKMKEEDPNHNVISALSRTPHCEQMEALAVLSPIDGQ